MVKTQPRTAAVAVAQRFTFTTEMKEALAWTPTKRAWCANVAQLVQYFQQEYGGGSSLHTLKAIIDPLSLFNIAEGTSNPDAVSNELLQQAIKPISTFDNMATIDDIPIWDRFSGEPLCYYDVFKCYLKMKESIGHRTLSRVAEIGGIRVQDIRTLSLIYHWQLRALAYDRRRAEELELERQHAARTLDNRLTKYSNDLIELASAYLDEHANQLNPKLAIELFKTVVPIARISVGLPGTAPAEERKFPSGSGRTSDVQVNINNVNGDNSSATSVHGLSESEVIDKLSKQNEDPAQLASILNVLNQSGAFENTILNDETLVGADYIIEEADESDVE